MTPPNTTMRRARAWWRAARPLAQVNIAVPILVGEALAFAVTGSIDWVIFALVHVLGVIDQLFIVFANDVADVEGDRANETFNEFSGGSRVLVDGALRPAALAAAAKVMAVLLVFGGTGLALGYGRPWLILGCVAGVALLWAYSYPPLRLSYRGYGEVAQGVGVGVFLPLLGFYSQTGSVDAMPWVALAPLFLFAVASNITTSLPDAPADEACGKQTWPVRFKARRARKHSLQLIALAVVLIPFALPNAEKWVWAAIEVPPLALLLLNTRGIRGADAENRAACRRFVIINSSAANLAMVAWLIALVAGSIG